MTTMFKKTLLATALFAAAGAANAAIVTQTAVNYSAQGIATTVNAPTSIYIALDAEYAVGDTITIKFPGAEFGTGNAPVLTGLDTGGAADTAIDDLTDGDVTVAAAADGLTFGRLSASGDTATFRVTALDQTATPTTINGVLELTGVKFKGSSLTASKAVAINYSAQTSTGVAIDVATTNNGKLIAVKDQFTLEVGTKADAKIDVAADRKLFDATLAADKRAVTLALTTTSEAYQGAVTADAVVYTVAGDFSWVDQDADGEVSETELETAIDGLTVATHSLEIADDFQSITFEKAAVGATSVDLTISAADPEVSEVVINPTDYTVTAQFQYPTDKTFSLAEAAGSWSLNGSVVRVPYLVLQDGRFGSIVNVTNHSSKNGAITLDVFAEDGTKIASNYAAGTSKAGSVTSVGNALRNALVAAGKDLTKVNKVSVQVVTNVPEDDVIVYAAYTDSQNGGERAIVNNDSKVQTK